MKTRIGTFLIVLSLLSLLPFKPYVSPAGAARQSAPPVVTPPPRPAAGALMIGWHEDGDDVAKLQRHERTLGKRFAIVRTYQPWALPGRRVDGLVRDGRLVIASHKPPDPGDGGWKAVASGREDATIHALARKYRSYGRQIVFTFHHEPHDDASDVKSGGRYGKSSEYKAAWRRIHDIFVKDGAAAVAGGNVYFGYVATWDWMLRGNPAGSADAMYPGDDTVDIFAHDKYNWYDCHRTRWEEFGPMWGPILDLAAARQKYVIPAEWGSPPAGGRRNEWFTRAAHFMKTDARARQWMIGFAYYHSFHDNCHWDFMNQGTDGREGWIAGFSKDPYFVSEPFSLAAPSAASPAGAPAPAPNRGPAASPASRQTPAPTRWSAGTRHTPGLPPGSGEMSGLAASRRYPGWMWGVRDSGNPASLYALQQADGKRGEFRMIGFPVRGATNRDWEDVVYGEEGGTSFLYVIDQSARVVYKVAEPDPTRPGTATVAGKYRYRFPDASPRGCGPRDNVEAAFIFPPVTGALHLVRKSSNPAGVYQFGALSQSETNVPRRVGQLSDAGCISVAAVSADGRQLVTASHDRLRVRNGDGGLASLLSGAPTFGASVNPDNNEAGTFFPFGAGAFVLGAENRNTWVFG